MGRLGLRNRRLGVALVLSSLLIFGILGVVGYLFQLPLTMSFIATTSYGEKLEASITVTARPSFLSYLSRRWSLAWRVGSTQRETVNIKIQILVTGTNIASDATAYFYVEARDSSGSPSYKEIDYSSGTQVTVGSTATFQTGSMTIDTHLSHLYGSAPTSDKTVDYYVWCRVETTGLISGQTLTVEIPVTKFDTVTYDYGVETTATDTFQISSTTYARFVMGRDSSYSTAHDTAEGVYLSPLKVGQDYYSASGVYEIYRSFLEFDTSSLPDSADITSVKLKLYVEADRSDTDFDICVQKWTGSTPIDTDDYNQFDGVNYGSLNTGNIFSSGWYEISLDSSVVNKKGATRLCLRSSRDTSSTQPTGREYVEIDSPYTSDGQEPTLEVTYSYIDWSASWSWVNAATLSIMALDIIRDLLTVVALFMSIIVSWLTIQTYRRRLKR